MMRRRNVLHALLGFGAALTIGPATLSLPELAQALTRAGMPCRTSPALANRGAFVCLKNRTPEAVRALVGEALGVVFRPEGSEWSMTVDPEAKDRERRLLVAYRRQAVERAREWATEQDRSRGGRGYDALGRWVDAQLPRLKAIPAGAEGLARAEREAPPVLNAALLLEPSRWCAARDARDASLVSAAVERSASVSARPSFYGIPLNVLVGHLEPSVGAPTWIGTSWKIAPDTGLFDVSATMGFASGKSFEAGSPRQFNLSFAGMNLVTMGVGSFSFHAESPTLQETFTRMGDPARAYLASLAPAPLPDAPEVEGRSNTLSNVLERLGGQGVEAIMELSPRFEKIPLRELPVRTSLRRALLPPDEPPMEWQRSAPAWLWEIYHPSDNPARNARRYPWRAVSRGGAWLVVNPLAFLDRVQWISPLPYLRAERILAKVPSDAAVPDWVSDQRLPDWRLLTEIAQAVGEDAVDTRADGYRGVRLTMLAPLFPLARLVAKLPPSERATLWQAAGKKEGVSLPSGRGRLTLRVLSIQPLRTKGVVARVIGQYLEDGKTVSAFEGYLDGRDIVEDNSRLPSPG